eukprot:scaffold221605_cov22-Tisochrysis_lutea.AAC.1
MDRAELAGKQGWFQLSKSCPCKGERENKGAHQFIIARQASIFVSSQPYHIGGIIHEQSIHSPTNSACQYAPACVYKSSLHTLIVSMTAEPLDEDASTKDYIRGGSLMRANKGVRVVSEGVYVVRDTSSIRWVISRELILSAGDLELNEAALEEAYIERGLGSELATHVASIIASSQGTHSRKPSVTGSQAAHSRKPSIAGSQAAHSRKNSNVPKVNCGGWLQEEVLSTPFGLWDEVGVRGACRA